MTVKGFLPRNRLQTLIERLHDAGYQCQGPQVRDGSIVFDTLETTSQLPAGITDHQEPGRYRLEQHNTSRYFDWAVGPQALKPLSYAPRETLWHCERNTDGRLQFVMSDPAAPAVAVIGARACDLAALAIHDQHFLGGDLADAHYRARRERLFLVAVHCNRPAATCFCASTGDGPRAELGFDLALQELDEGFLVESGTERGLSIATRLALEEPAETQFEQAERDNNAATAGQQRRLPEGSLRERMFERLEHPRWDDAANRCLSCGNCTMVCPTCFCHVEVETPTLNGRSSEHARQWDSCFTADHSYFAHMVVRETTRLRYRQWLTHKLGSWHEQFGRSGCVGCGRCITWCPVGIDITEEAEAICGNAG